MKYKLGGAANHPPFTDCAPDATQNGEKYIG